MIKILEDRAKELSKRLAELSAHLNEIETKGQKTSPKILKTLKDFRSQTMGQYSVYDAGPILTISDADAATEYLKKLRDNSKQLLNDLRREGESLDDVKADAPRIDGYYHETLYALALIRFFVKGEK